jgi:hypothetical protein
MSAKAPLSINCTIPTRTAPLAASDAPTAEKTAAARSAKNANTLAPRAAFFVLLLDTIEILSFAVLIFENADLYR